MSTIKGGKVSLEAVNDTETRSASHTILCSDNPGRGTMKLKSVAASYYHPVPPHKAYSGDDSAAGCVEVRASLNSIAQLLCDTGLKFEA